jgi:hypothetical protein
MEALLRMVQRAGEPGLLLVEQLLDSGQGEATAE